ncbi:MAG TPA: hypothetical protein VFW19_02570 [Allosphingosinicella sp.]|nr:hypothetical protein [Allosphingosinicella sp.]
MKGWIGIAALLAGSAALSACGAKRDPNMPTPEENEQLDNIAEMLDAPGTNSDADLGNGAAVAEEADASGADNAADNKAGNR